MSDHEETTAVSQEESGDSHVLAVPPIMRGVWGGRSPVDGRLARRDDTPVELKATEFVEVEGNCSFIWVVKWYDFDRD